ncbi:thiol:disulfide oxidoreductase TlpA [alpha proteobacterium U9-1i]|nr:thiol:disulfide oxidoreductase TlpA [alpha proteobacterium U9-1i]
MVLIAVGAVAVLYVLFAASSKPEQGGLYSAYARGGLGNLVVLEEVPPMPAETLRDAEGNATTLASLSEGQVTLVNLWATWCAPCITEMPTIGALARQYEGRLNVIAVSVDSEAKEADARSQLAQLSEGSLAFYIEPSRGVLFSMRAAGMPVTVLYGRDGRERARLVGGADWASPEAMALIDAALAEP